MAKVRVKKREAVIPFDGEENFVVPKRGGFGQPDNENYVMVAGANVPAPDLPTNDGSNTGTSGTGIAIGEPQQPILTGTRETTITPAEPTPTIPAPLTPQQICVANGDSWINGRCIPKVVADEPSPAETTCIANGGAWIDGACVISSSPKDNVVTNLPNFPVWSSLDCVTLKDKIAEYNAILSTSKFAQNIVDAYNTEIAKAQGIYNGKCNVTPPAPASIVLPPIGGGGIFGGGGGGGFGEPPIDEVAPIEDEKNNMGIYLIIGGIALIYFLTRKKKQ
jgi:hypothetical protein